MCTVLCETDLYVGGFDECCTNPLLISVQLVAIA